MIDWTLSLGLNAFSGLLFVAVGAAAALRRGSKARAGAVLFLMTWGIQLALTNIAARSSTDQTAFLLFWLSELLVPLQGMLLLHFVAQRTKENPGDTASRVYRFCQTATRLAALIMLAGLLVALAFPAQIMTVQRTEEGLHETEWGPMSALFFDAPQLLGVGLALLLLVWPATQQQVRKDWSLVSGLAFAWAYSVTYNLVFEHDWLAIVFMALSLASAAILVPFKLVQARLRQEGGKWRAWTPLPLLIPLGALVALLAPHAPDNWLWLLSPGIFRIIALGWLVPALVLNRDSQALEMPAWSKRVPAVFVLAFILLAAILMGLPLQMTAAAGGLALAGVVVIAALDGSEVRHLLLPM